MSKDNPHLQSRYMSFYFCANPTYLAAAKTSHFYETYPFQAFEKEC